MAGGGAGHDMRGRMCSPDQDVSDSWGAHVPIPNRDVVSDALVADAGERIRSLSEIETQFLLDGCPVRSGFSGVALFGAGQFPSVIQISQSVAQLAQHDFGVANVAIHVRPGCRAIIICRNHASEGNSPAVFNSFINR